MAELAIVPGAPGAQPYLELGETGKGRRFVKHILTLNKSFLHPKSGRPITLGEDAWRSMKANFDSQRIIQQPVFTLADENNRHSEHPLNSAGLITGLEREGDRVLAVIDVKDPAAAERIADGRLPGASAFLALDAKDPQTAERAGAALLHVCGTLRPALVDLAPYEPAVAACGPSFATMPDGSVLNPQVLMLCQSEVDAPVTLAAPARDYHEPVYSGGPAMDDFLRDERDRLGLEAQRISLGLPSRPSYDHVALEAESQAAGLSVPAEAELTEEDCGEFGLLLAAAVAQPFSDIMAAARELAFEADEQAAGEPRNVAAALLDLTGRLGLSADDLRPDGLLELSAASELDRLASDNAEDLAGPPGYEDAAIVALSAGGSGRDTADSVVARHPELAHLFKAGPGRTSGRRHPAGRNVTTATRAHSSDLYDDPRDLDQPAKGGKPHRRGLQEIMADNPGLFTGDAGQGTGNHSYPAQSPAEREAASNRAHGAGRGKFSIQQLGRKIQRGSNVTHPALP